MREVLSTKGLKYKYDELVTESDLERFMNETGMMGLPVLVVNGIPMAIGTVDDVENAIREGGIYIE